MSKTVKFTSNIFYNICSNFYISDQIASFDENLIEKYKINCFINCTKNSPFLNNSINIKVNIFNNSSINQVVSENVLKKLDSVVKTIYKLLLSNTNILLYCENGYSKSILFVLCLFIKYPNLISSSLSKEYTHSIGNIQEILKYISSKVELSNLITNFNKSNNLYIVIEYRNYLINKRYTKENMKGVINLLKQKFNYNNNIGIV